MSIEYSVSNCIYKIYLPDNIAFDLLDYAQTAINCTTNCSWRSTQYFEHYSVNLFRKKIWLLMTMFDITDVICEFEKDFGFKPADVVLINCTMLYDIKKKVDLDTLYDKLCTADMEDIFEIKTKDNMHLYLDKQKFPALIITPNRSEKLVIEIYSSGKINTTGIKNDVDKAKIDNFIRNFIFQFV